MKHVLMVGRSLEMLTKGVKHGVRYSLLCKNAPRIGLDDLQPFSRIVMLNPDADVQEWIAQARLIHEHDPVDVIGGFTEDEEATSAEIAAALGLRYHTAGVVANTHDKFRMRQTLRAAGVDDTRSCLLQQNGGEGLDRVHHAEDIDVECGGPLFDRAAKDRVIEDDAGIGKHRTDTQARELALDRFEACGDALGAGERADQRVRVRGFGATRGVDR